ncbi:hypothetical protein D3C74_451600 [compost metagenome]
MVSAGKQLQIFARDEHLRLVVAHIGIGFRREPAEQHIHLNHPDMMAGRNADLAQ